MRGVREMQRAQTRDLRGWELATMSKGSPFQVRCLFLVNMYPLDFYMCVQDKKEFSVQVKNRIRVRILNHAFIFGTPVLMVANTNNSQAEEAGLR